MDQSVFAIINGGQVVNLAVGTYAGVNNSAKEIFGSTAFAEEVWSMYYPPAVQKQVCVGDTFVNGCFFHNGTMVQPATTIEAEVSENSSAIDDLWVALLEG